MQKGTYYTLIGATLFLTVISIIGFFMINLQRNMTQDDWASIITGLKFFLGFLAIITLVIMIIGAVGFLIHIMNRADSKNKAPRYTLNPVFNVTPDMLEQQGGKLNSGTNVNRRRSRRIGNGVQKNIDYSDVDGENWSVLGEEDVRMG